MRVKCVPLLLFLTLKKIKKLINIKSHIIKYPFLFFSVQRKQDPPFMELNYRKLRFTFFFLSLLFCTRIYSQCNSLTPVYTVNLSSSPTMTYSNPSINRASTCCTAQSPDECVQFVITLHPNAMGINFDVLGAGGFGSNYYQVNCQPALNLNTPICLNNAGPHYLTFCKPGNNSYTYNITSLPKPSIPDSVFVRNGCTQTLVATGFSAPTISWTSVPANTLYNTYLNCLSGCPTVVVSGANSPTSSILYEVSGYGIAPCTSSLFRDTVRVYFYNDLLPVITPSNPTICFGGSNVTLTVTATGGKTPPPYTYSWTTGSTQPTVNVGAGSYTATVFDATGCPGMTVAVTVNQFTANIGALAGTDKTLCSTSPNTTLNGTINIATGGVWSGGTGTFTPSFTTMAVTYIPPPSEVTTGSVQLYLTSTGNSGCPPAKDTVNLFFQVPPVPNAGSSRTVCANNSTTALNGTITGFPATPLWSTTGSGAFSTTNNLVTTYSPSSGDKTTGSVSIVLTTTNNGACPAAQHSLNLFINPSPTVNAGPDFTICSVNSASLANSYTLGGIITGSSNTGTWTASGDGTFSPSSSILNPVYTPGPNDINTGSVSLVFTSLYPTCLPVRDTMKLFIRKQPVVNAGPNKVICSSTGTVALNGTVTGVSATTAWSASGSGGLSGAGNPAVYSINSTDINNGSVIFTLTASGNGPCNAIYDTVLVNIDKLAVPDAGMNFKSCASNLIIITGSVTSAAGTGSWSTTGTGTFASSSQSVGTSYLPSPADINNGLVTFTLTSTANGTCPAQVDTLMLRIVKQPTVLLSVPLQICSTATAITLSSTVTGGVGTGSWSTSGSGNFGPAPTNSAVTYVLQQPADGSAASLIFTVTSTGMAPCPESTGSATTQIIKPAVPDAGLNFGICSSQNTIGLAGTVLSTAGTGSWSASGSGPFSPNANTLTTGYSITPLDIANGTVIFTLSSTNNTPCAVVRDTVMIRITKSPVPLAGADQSICYPTTPSVALNGTVNFGGGVGTWVTLGSGTVIPSGGVSAQYIPSAGDLANLWVDLMLKTANNGYCPEKTDTMRITLRTPAVVNAGAYNAFCSSVLNIPLNGSIAGSAGTGTWASSGGGTFAPTPSLITAGYFLSQFDINSGAVTLTLTSTNNGACPAVSATTSILINKMGSSAAGTDKNICSSQQLVLLTGTVLGTNSGTWSSTGTGTLTGTGPASATYSITETDINNGVVLFSLGSTNNGVCPSSNDTMKVTITRNPEIKLRADTTLCETTAPIKITSTVVAGIGGWQWNTTGTGSFVPNSNLPFTNYIMSATDIRKGSVILMLSSINNGPCGTVSGQRRITISPSPKAAFSVQSYTFYLPAEPAVFTNNTTGGKTYLWDFGEGPTAKETSPSHRYTSTGFYTVTLKAVSDNGCMDSTSKVITVLTDVKIPNAFTPNPNNSNGGSYSPYDLNNDVFHPYAGGVTEYDLRIYNRWGEMIFRSQDINIGWDGYFNGRLCQQDAYVWKLDLKFFDGRNYNNTGTLTLLR
jgi:gliding motility-associated-like protein